eukprot:TRINITY_DN99_c0_g1_i1.p1 TRINITY_DN99_c0_g1~~TRINITY_DN99_c0_g1_i1.p1  ORF type:complete len:175 (-),score=23.06 TRINITY_DN99_c0_g1_i1:199-723(-)
MISNKLNPLSFTRKLNETIDKLQSENNVNIEFYRSKLYEMGVIVLLRQLSFCYKSISWHRFKELTFDCEKLSEIDLERIITFSVFYGDICCRISHSDKLITFYDDTLESDTFCKSMIELNDILLCIKNDIDIDIDTDTDIQRQNVFDQIRTQIPLEHDKIQKRLNAIKWTQRQI